jgi:hypothetical protein
MTSLRVVAIVWACPGGWLGARAIPAAAQPLLCAPLALVEDYDPAQRRQAEDRVRHLGAGARLEECRLGRGCIKISDWRTIVEFKEN